MAIKGIKYGQVFIDMKTKITSYGPHDGIIVCCGIQQEPNLFWPFALGGTSNSVSPQPFNVAPTSASIHRPDVEGNRDDKRNKGAPCISDRSYQLTDKDIASTDNFDAPEKVRLNIFEANPAIVELRPSDVKSVNCKSYSSSTVPKIFNGGSPRKFAHNIGHQRNSERIMEDEASNENMRKEHVIHSGRNAVDSYVTPMIQCFEKTPNRYKHYGESSDQFKKYYYNQIEKNFARDRFPIETSIVTTDPKMDSEFRNDVAICSQKASDYRSFSPENLAKLTVHSSDHQRQQRNTPDLDQVRLKSREVPEQLYHLYETQDAFGNLLAQFRSESEMSEQNLPQSLSMNVSDYDGNNRNLMNYLGLTLIPEDLELKSRFKNIDRAEPSPVHIQHNSQSSIKICDNVNISRDSNDSQHIQSMVLSSLIPTSLEKVQRSIDFTQSNEIRISANMVKNVSEETAEHFKIPTSMWPTISSQQLQKIPKKRPNEQDLMEKKENLDNILEESRFPFADAASMTHTRATSIKPILHMSFRKSNLKKKVQFPAERPKMSSLEHRLLLDDFNLI